MPEAIQYKTITASLKQGEEEGSFEAVIATIGVKDHDGDVVEAGALAGLTMSIVPSHDWMNVPLGKATIEERSNGSGVIEAVAVGKFNREVSDGRDWHEAIKFDLAHPPAVQEWSWGYRPKEWRMGELNGEEVRFLSKLDVEEISPVLRGASIGTRTLSAKSAKRHETETTDAIWDEGAEIVRIVKFRVQRDETGIEHHDAEGKASIRACYAGICALNSSRFEDPNRKAIYEHLAGHLEDAEIEAPLLLDSPGVKLVDQIKLATWAAETAKARVSDLMESRAEKGRPVNDETKTESVLLATAVADLDRVAKSFSGLVESVSPEDPLALAVADYQAAGLRSVLDSSE